LLPRLQRTMGGSYGYNLGYLVEDQGLRAPRMRSRTHYPLMSDSPRVADLRSDMGSSPTAQHGRRGHNILFEDGHVKSVIDAGNLTASTLPWTDHPFLNRSGLVAAGEDAEDVVIAESSARAIPVILKPLPASP
jgi:prepilin-type processing-associated H-X9-DG protein